MTTGSESSPALSFAELQLLARSSPAGLAWVANLRPSSVAGEPSRFAIARHIEHLNDHLVRLAARDYLRAGYLGLLIEEPPRHGKSELVSHYDSAWYLGNFPDERVVLVSYADEFASMWGRRARNTLEEWGPPIFGVAVDPRSKAADRWDLVGRRGGMVTAGIGGGITGRGADVLKVDDPFKNAEQAQSKAYRDHVWNEWRATLRPRIEPGGVAILVATRWHEDDLTGRLLRAMDEDPEADRWIRVRLPALAEENDVLGREPGDALWPERYSAAELAKIRASVGSYVFSALYQQRPAPPQGGMFERSWLENHVLERAPDAKEIRKVVRAWDLAATDAASASDPDHTVGAKVALTKQGQFVILDVVRVRKSSAEVERLFEETTRADGRRVEVWIEEERGSAGKYTVSMLARKVPGYTVRGEKPTGSKTTRARPVSAAAERGDVKLVRARWNEALIDEFEVFDFGTHDDQVDAVSLAVQKLSRSARLVSY